MKWYAGLAPKMSHCIALPEGPLAPYKDGIMYIEEAGMKVPFLPQQDMMGLAILQLIDMWQECGGSGQIKKKYLQKAIDDANVVKAAWAPEREVHLVSEANQWKAFEAMTEGIEDLRHSIFSLEMIQNVFKAFPYPVYGYSL